MLKLQKLQRVEDEEKKAKYEEFSKQKKDICVKYLRKNEEYTKEQIKE